jgi:4-hydroxybenzoate polyprenyltransferase
MKNNTRSQTLIKISAVGAVKRCQVLWMDGTEARGARAGHEARPGVATGRLPAATAWEALAAHILSKPLGFFEIAVWLARGSEHLRTRLTATSGGNGGPLPWHTQASPPFDPMMLAMSMRPRQWVKNTLVLVPLALSGKGLEGGRLGQVLLAFLALSLMTGATYIVNDLVDLPNDRQHRSKRLRPLASGRLAIVTALAAAPLAIAASLLLGTCVSPWVAAFLLVYLAGTLAYSFGLKRIPCVDAVTLGGLFTVRLVVGIFAADVAASAWLLVFSMFLFTSLSYAKRHAEIAWARTNGDGLVGGRGYTPSDGPLVLAFGVASGLSASLILILYIIEDVLTIGAYQNKIGLWLLPLLLHLLLARIWIKSHRQEMDDDPVEFVIRDRVSLVLLAISVLCWAVSWHGPQLH